MPENLRIARRTRRATSFVAVLAAVGGMLAGVGLTTAPTAQADASTGTAGFFTPVAGRALDTNNTGGNLQPGTVQQVVLGGTNIGIPTSGVTAVALTVTAVDTPAVTAPAVGSVVVQPYGVPVSTSTSQLSWRNSGERVSNTAMVAVSSDVKIQVSATVATRVLIDVQGYYSSGNGAVAPGGFVPNTLGGQKVTDTRDGTGGVAAQKIPAGGDLVINLAGQAQVASTATAVFANITVVSYDTHNGYVVPYPTGGSTPPTSLNYPGQKVTSLGSVVDINSNESFTIHVGSGSTSPVDLEVDIQGYFDDSDTRGAFTPGAARVYDTTTSANLQIAPNSLREVQVTGTSGVPTAASGIGALALEVTTISTNSSAGNHVTIWGHDQAEPATAAVNVSGAITESGLDIVVPGATDTVFVRNTGNAAIDLVFDVEGWYKTAGNLPAASSSNCAASGQRASSHQIPHQITDRASISWNPVNGNMNLREPLIHLTGAGQSIDFGLRYNSLNDARPTFTAGWTESSITVDPVNNTVTYTGPDGACYVFVKTGTTNGVATYSSPPYVNATLTQQDQHTFYLRMNPSLATNIYKDVAGDGTSLSVWELVSSSDSTGGNPINYTYDAAKNRLASIAEADAPSRKLNFAYTDTRNPLQPSKVTDVSTGRTMTFTYAGPAGAMDTVTDAAGTALTFGYTGNQITAITDNNTDNNLETNGPGHTTGITYDSSRRVATWTYASTGAATASTYTAAYISSTQTTLTDALHPATKFALANTTSTAPAGIGTAVVTITDPLTHPTNFSYTSHGDINATTNALTQTASSTFGSANYLTTSGTAAGTTSGSTTTPGASTFLNYPGDDRSTTAKNADGSSVAACAAASSPLGNYRPCSSTDAQGNTSTYTYDSASQNVTTVTTAGGAGGTQTFTYQGQNGSNGVASCGAENGQICTASDGNNNVTSFAYNVRGDLTTVDRPGGLGDIVLGYDAAGRIASRTDGGGNTSYFTYDGDDRPIRVTVDTTDCVHGTTGSCVEYLYDHAGNLLSRTDRTGQTTYTFDQQNRLIEKKTVDASTNTVTADSLASYDAIGNRLSNTDLTNAGNQTTSYGYDAGNRVVWLGEPGTTSCPAVSVAPTSTTAGCVLFLYDDANRRTDSYLPNGRDNHVDYDTDSRPSYLDNRPYGGNTYGATAGRTYAYTTGPKNNGSNTAGGLVSGSGTALGNYSSYYRYDAMNRVTNQGSVANPTDSASSGYWHYDHNGNRISATTTSSGSTYATYNAANQLCWTGATGTDSSTCGGPTAGSTSYTYDAAGNLSGFGPTGSAADHSYAYSSYDQLTSTTYSGVTTGYGYADVTSDERTQAGTAAIDNGINGIDYVEDGNQRIEYIRDPAGTLIELRAKNGGAAWVTQYYTLDRLGSVILLTASNGATTAAPTYDVWGVTTSAAPTNTVALLNRYGYASGYTDPATGLIKYGTRYYAPSLGVWTQADPSAQGSNYYIYAGDDPITNADPTGRSWLGTALKFGALAVGAAAVFASGGLAVGALAVGAAALDGAGGALNGESGWQIAGDVGVDLATGGIGGAGEAADLAKGSKYLLNGTSFAGNATYATGDYYGSDDDDDE